MDGNERRVRAGAEATEWWLRLEAGPMSREERGAYVDWLRESPVHVSEMLRMGQLHAVLDEFQDWEQIASVAAKKSYDCVVPFDRATNDLQTRGSHRRVWPKPAYGSRRYGWLAAAAVIVAVLGVWLSTFTAPQVIQTGRGERRGVVLADGSMLRIDPESRLRVRLQRHLRDVKLEQGRAVFRVAKDAARPFLVHAGSTVVRAVGTEFGVERARDGVVVTVAAGKVAVFPRDEQPAGYQSGSILMTAARLVGQAPPDRRSGDARDGRPARPQGGTAGTANSEVFLTAGEQVTVPPSGTAEAVKQVDSNDALAWADGRLVFQNSSVADVVEQFNRYNLVQLHVGDPQLATRLVNGVFDANEPDSFISVIRTIASVRVERRGQDVTLFSVPSPQ
ncbi:MAG TPA: FecR domain-containing protein [Steroidobacteraceae bacterium]